VPRLRVGLSLNTNSGAYENAVATPEENRSFVAALIAQAQHADRAGFDGIFVAERHSRPECRWPAPLQLLTLLAAHTSRVDLVTHVLLLPLHHPVDIAEQAALLDVYSGGRLVLGIGMGFNQQYFDTFGVPIKQRLSRFEEGIDILKLAWRGEPFDYHGKRHDLTGSVVLPAPETPGGPPLWIGGQSLPSVRRAAAVGDGWVVAWPLGEEDWKRLTDEYYAGCEERGKTPEICVSRHCWVGENRAEVEKWFVPMWLEEMKYYWKKGQLIHPDFASEGDFTVDTARKHLVYGSPSDCVETLAELAESVDYVKLSLRLPLGPSMDEVDRCVTRVGAEVLPALRAAGVSA